MFNQDRQLKERFPIKLKNIRRIEVSKNSNFFCIVDLFGQYHVLESIRKEELLNYVVRNASLAGHEIKIEKVVKMTFENSEQKQISFDPMMVKIYKPYWIPTFDFALKNTCLGYARRDASTLGLFESVFEQKDKCILILAHFVILVLSTIEFNIKDVIPLVGVKVYNKNFEIILTLSDSTKKSLQFFSELDRNIWSNAIEAAVKNLGQK